MGVFRRKDGLLRFGWPVFFLLTLMLLAPGELEAKCNPGLVRYFQERTAVPVAYGGGSPRVQPGPVSIEWFGHAFFRLISPGGTRIVTDPFSPFRGFPIPQTSPHLVTTSEDSTNHNYVESVGGKPLVFHGVVDGEWARVDQRVRDVRVLSVPIVQGSGEFDFSGGKASSFLFEMGGMCVAHLGDLGAPMNPEQLRRLGKVHVALVIISDPGAMSPEVSAQFIQRLNPNVAIPMDIRSEEDLNGFLRSFRRVRRLKTARVALNRRSLPRPTEVIVLRQPQEAQTQ